MKMLGTLKSYAHELRNRKTPKQEANAGLNPLVAAGPRVVGRHLGGQGGGQPKEEEGEEKGRVMVLVLVKVMELDFEGEVKRKVMEMMMMILEVEVVVMGVVLWW